MKNSKGVFSIHINGFYASPDSMTERWALTLLVGLWPRCVADAKALLLILLVHLK